MPRLDFSPSAVEAFKALPRELARSFALTAIALLSDPRPKGAEPYAGIPDAYRYEHEQIVVFYRVIGQDVDILIVRPNS